MKTTKQDSPKKDNGCNCYICKYNRGQITDKQFIDESVESFNHAEDQILTYGTVEQFIEYTQHKKGCAGDKKCNCGLTKILRKFKMDEIKKLGE